MRSPYFANIETASQVAPWTDVQTGVQAHRRSYQYAMRDDWDGSGAAALTPEVVQLANRLIGQYASSSELVEVAPGKDGSVSFVWEDDRGNYVYVDVGPGDTVHLYYEVTGRGKWEGVSVASDPRLLREMAHAFQFLRSAVELARSLPVASPNSYGWRLAVA